MKNLIIIQINPHAHIFTIVVRRNLQHVSGALFKIGSEIRVVAITTIATTGTCLTDAAHSDVIDFIAVVASEKVEAVNAILCLSRMGGKKQNTKTKSDEQRVES